MGNTPMNDFLSVCESFSTAMLVTQSPDNRLVARPMMVAELEPDGKHASQGEYWSDAETNRIKYLFDVAKTYVSGHRSGYSDHS